MNIAMHLTDGNSLNFTDLNTNMDDFLACIAKNMFYKVRSELGKVTVIKTSQIVYIEEI